MFVWPTKWNRTEWANFLSNQFMKKTNLGGGNGGSRLLFGDVDRLSSTAPILLSRCGGGGIAPALFVGNFFGCGRWMARKSFCNESLLLILLCFGLASASRMGTMPLSKNNVSDLRFTSRLPSSSNTSTPGEKLRIVSKRTIVVNQTSRTYLLA